MDNKVMTIELEGFESPGFEVLSFRGSEALSTPFRYSVSLGSSNPSQDFDGLLEAKAHLSLGHPAVNIRGILASIQQGYDSAWKPDEGTLTRFEVVIVPQIYKLSLSSRTRIFQEMSVPDIVKKILNEAGIPGDEIEWKLSGKHEKRDFILQYHESNLDFCHRLLEGEGIYYYFDHGEDVEKCVFGDANGSFEPISGDPEVRLGKPDITIGETGVGPWGYEQTNTRFQSRQRVVPKKLILKDYNFQKSSLDLSVDEEFKDLKALVGTQYYFGENYLMPAEGKAITTLRKQEILARRRVFMGGGNVRRLYPGGRFSQGGLGGVDADLVQEYIVTEMTSEGSQPIANVDRMGTYHYGNDFTCIPEKVDFRPDRRTPWPQVPGVVHAKVCASAGAGTYAHMDDRGRYKVKFLFDIDYKEDDDKASCWVRHAEPYVGATFGFHSPLLKGFEVLVAFENGDPDRPVIIGCVYNTDFPSPTTNANHAQHFWKSSGNNEIRYDDTQGSEHVYLHGQKDWNIKIENDKTQGIGHDETMDVGNDRTKTVGHDQTVTIKNDKTTKVGANHTEDVGKDQKITIGANKTESVATNATETVGATKKVDVKAAYQTTVTGAMNTSVGGAKAIEVKGALKYAVGGPSSQDVKGEKKITVAKDFGTAVDGATSLAVKKTYSVKVTEGINIESEKEIVIKTGKASITMKKDGTIVIDGKDVQIKGSGEIVAKASKDMTLKGKNILQN